jgi:hypothetical protein
MLEMVLRMAGTSWMGRTLTLRDLIEARLLKIFSKLIDPLPCPSTCLGIFGQFLYLVINIGNAAHLRQNQKKTSSKIIKKTTPTKMA